MNRKGKQSARSQLPPGVYGSLFGGSKVTISKERPQSAVLERRTQKMVSGILDDILDNVVASNEQPAGIALTSCQGPPAMAGPAAKKPRLGKPRDWEKDSLNRKFNPDWASEMTWLKYDADANLAFCVPCKATGKRGLGAGTSVLKKSNFVDHQVRPCFLSIKMIPFWHHMKLSFVWGIQVTPGHITAVKEHAAKSFASAVV